MLNEPQDHPEEESEEVLTFVEKCKRYYEAGKWLKRLYTLGQVLFFGSTAAVVVGQVVDKNFLNDAITEVGILQEEVHELDEELIELQAVLEKVVVAEPPDEHTHPAVSHSHPVSAINKALIAKAFDEHNEDRH